MGLRTCTFEGKKHYFHMWFQEGGFDSRNSTVMDGSIDIGAILEDENGNIQKVWKISEIKFDVEEKQ